MVAVVVSMHVEGGGARAHAANGGAFGQVLVLAAVLLALVYQWYTDPARAERAAVARRLAAAQAAEAEARRRHRKPAETPSVQPSQTPATAPPPKQQPKPPLPAPVRHAPTPAPAAHPALRATLKGHVDAVVALAVSLDGKYLASASTGAARSSAATVPPPLPLTGSIAQTAVSGYGASRHSTKRVCGPAARPRAYPLLLHPSLTYTRTRVGRYARVNIELDHATALAFTADAHNLLYARADTKTLHVLKRTKVNTCTLRKKRAALSGPPRTHTYTNLRGGRHRSLMARRRGCWRWPSRASTPPRFTRSASRRPAATSSPHRPVRACFMLTSVCPSVSVCCMRPFEWGSVSVCTHTCACMYVSMYMRLCGVCVHAPVHCLCACAYAWIVCVNAPVWCKCTFAYARIVSVCMCLCADCVCVHALLCVCACVRKRFSS
jgi:hypothetical protein